MPFIRAWAAKYKDAGLVVIGIHSPEFEFEKSVDNVSRAAKDMRVDYPIAVANIVANMSLCAFMMNAALPINADQ